MSQPVLYVLPESHTNEEDQARKEMLEDLASWGSVLRDSNKPKVFALVVGALHVTVSEHLVHFKDFAGRMDLRTVLGHRIDAGTQSVEVNYDNPSLVVIAKRALELSGSLPFGRRAKAMLGWVFISVQAAKVLPVEY